MAWRLALKGLVYTNQRQSFIVAKVKHGLHYSRVERLIDRLIEMRFYFYIPVDTKQVISETFPPVNRLAWYGKKLDLTQQKHAFASQKKKKLKGALRPGARREHESNGNRSINIECSR